MRVSHIAAIFFPLLLVGIIFLPLHAQETASGTTEKTVVETTDAEQYMQDGARLIKEPFRSQILSAAREIESQMKIRVLIKTEILDDLTLMPQRIDLFFSEWIRSIVLEKRGILLYAALPRDSLQGKFNLRVGIGLKYLITREMGERILHRVILPNNVENKDGKGFLEGVLTIKRMLLDELKRESNVKRIPAGRSGLYQFFWASKEIFLALVIGCFLCYIVFFVERCPRCNNTLRIRYETLKEPGSKTLGVKRKIFACEKCGFSRRKKEPVYPSGRIGWWMWLTGNRRNVRIIPNHQGIPVDLSSEDRRNPPE